MQLLINTQVKWNVSWYWIDRHFMRIKSFIEFIAFIEILMKQELLYDDWIYLVKNTM